VFGGSLGGGRHRSIIGAGATQAVLQGIHPPGGCLGGDAERSHGADGQHRAGDIGVDGSDRAPDPGGEGAEPHALGGRDLCHLRALLDEDRHDRRAGGQLREHVEGLDTEAAHRQRCFVGGPGHTAGGDTGSVETLLRQQHQAVGFVLGGAAGLNRADQHLLRAGELLGRGVGRVDLPLQAFEGTAVVDQGARGPGLGLHHGLARGGKLLVSRDDLLRARLIAGRVQAGADDGDLFGGQGHDRLLRVSAAAMLAI